MTRVISDAEFAKIVSRELHDVGASIPVSISIGITGTRNTLANSQQFALGMLINTLGRTVDGPAEMHHGLCIGTDETSHYIAVQIPGIQIHGHPGYGAGKRSPYQMTYKPDSFFIIHPAKPYNKRNQEIVTASGILLACPRFPESDARSARSGTWQTIRMMKRARKPVIIIPPSGAIIHSHEQH